MLDRHWLKHLDREAANNLWQFKLADLDLTKRRLARMEAKREANPNFKAYDVWAEDFIDIDTRIEEQTFVKEDILDEIEDIDNRIKDIEKLEYLEELTVEHPNGKILKYDVIGKPVVQLGLFEGVLS